MKVEVDVPPPYEDQPDPNSLQVNLSEHGRHNFLVSVSPPKAPAKGEKDAFKRAPLDLCCVIDVSGSMETSAPALSEDGKSKEDTGLTVLDVVQHAMKTIIATLNENDRLAIVAFDSRAELITDFQSTNESGKKMLTQCVNKLVPKASTNLWDGLKMGMNLIANIQKNQGGSSPKGISSVLNRIVPSSSRNDSDSSESRLASLFILTDGQPNVNPPRGHIPMLQQWMESNPEARFAINSFGFGYDLEANLMSDIARTGGGHYGFIPDAGMVGTVFVHAIANLFATYATQCYLNVEVPDGAKVKKPKGDFSYTETSWGAKIDIGDIQYSQSRDFIIEVEGLSSEEPSDVTVTLNAKPWDAADAINTMATQTTSPESSAQSQEYEYHLHRLNLVSSMYAICAATVVGRYGEYKSAPLDEAKTTFETQAKVIQANLQGHAAAEALATDIGGEVTLAVSDSKAWAKWGKNYFPSLARAHQMQRCNNFKDPGLQIYGADSPLFIKARDLADAEFDKLPPPTPSAPPMPAYMYGRGRGGMGSAPQMQRAALHSMAQYNQRAGVCFTGDCLVDLADGTQVRMDSLRRGTAVMTAKGPAEISAVVKTKTSGKTSLCRIGDLKVTPWHPIYHEGKWTFPADILAPEMLECDAVYSVLLLPAPHIDAHSMIINDFRVVTLGHGLVDDEYEQNGGDVRNHSFFGNYGAVFDGLRELPGFYDDGVCECQGVVRDGQTGLIKGFVHPSSSEPHLEASTAQSIQVGA